MSKLNRRGFFGAIGGAVVGAMVAAGVRRVAPLSVADLDRIADALRGMVVPNPAYVAAPYEAAFLVADGRWRRGAAWRGCRALMRRWSRWRRSSSTVQMVWCASTGRWWGRKTWRRWLSSSGITT